MSTALAASICSRLRCLTNSGFPRNMMTAFFPSLILSSLTSTCAVATTSAAGAMLLTQASTVFLAT